MIVAAILVGLVTLGFLISHWAVSNVFFMEGYNMMNTTIQSTVTNPTELVRIDSIFTTLRFQFAATLIIMLLGIVAYVYISATQREVVTEAL